MGMKKTDKVDNLPTEEQVKKFLMIFPMLESMQNEMRTLSSKKQDGVLNSLKVKIINRLIDDARDILSKEPTLIYLDKLDEDTLPQNSDVVLILGQYIKAFEQYRKTHFVKIGYNEYKWNTQENPQKEI